jgi:hypothetical protein
MRVMVGSRRNKVGHLIPKSGHKEYTEVEVLGRAQVSLERLKAWYVSTGFSIQGGVLTVASGVEIVSTEAAVVNRTIRCVGGDVECGRGDLVVIHNGVPVIVYVMPCVLQFHLVYGDIVGFGHKLKLATALNVARHCGRRARFRGLSSSVGGEK